MSTAELCGSKSFRSNLYQGPYISYVPVMTNFLPLTLPPCKPMCTFCIRFHRFDTPVLTCSFVIISSYCFTSELFKTYLKQPISFFCLSHSPYSSLQPTTKDLSFNGGHKLLVILPLIIADEAQLRKSREELLL